MLTVINDSLHYSNVTRTNPRLSASVATRVNEALRDHALLREGAVLGGRWRLGSRLPASAGEADLFRCAKEEAPEAFEYVAKIYRRETAVRPEVLEKMSALNSPFLAGCLELGSWNGRPYEIQPYFSRGSLLGIQCDLDDLKDRLIPALNEGLHALHTAGIFHKDLKPANIVVRADGSVAIIDFGVSSAVEEGVTMLVTNTGMTPMYSAPETFRNIFLAESDYYSLGITIYELFTGHVPYADLSEEERERMISVQKIPLPSSMPSALKDLITGLTYPDLSARKDPSSPNRRWTYPEVCRWLKGEKLPVPGRSGSVLEARPYEFLGRTYSDLPALADALAMNWEQGKKELFRGKLSAYFEKVNTDAARVCKKAEAKASAASGEDDSIFFDTIYKLDRTAACLYWKGHQWENLPALGRELLASGEKEAGQGERFLLAGEMLEKGILARYLKMMDPSDSSRQQKLLSDLARIYRSTRVKKKNAAKYIYELGYMLSGQVVLSVDGQTFYDIPELAAYMQSLISSDFPLFRKLCSQLLIHGQDLSPQLEVWLMAQGKGIEVRRWRREFGLLTEAPETEGEE